MFGVVNFYLWVLSVVFISNSGLVASEVQLASFYNRANVTACRDSSVTFRWNFTGELRIAEWGTKQTGILDIDVNIFTLDIQSGPQSFNVPLYKGRVNGSWNLNSPGQVMFILNSIREDDDKIFLFKFTPKDLLAAVVFDEVQLIVRDPPKATAIPPVLPTVRGVTASFTCNASGLPLPNIIWMRQIGLTKNEITASNVNIQINSHPGSSQLVIQNASVDDQGYYICKASNYISDMARAFLGVISLYEDNDLCPTSIDARIGESITICCPVQGFPPPEVNWELPNGTLLKTENTILHLNVTTKDDFGRYRCHARGLEDTVLNPVVTVNKKIKDVSIDVVIGTEANTIRWTKVEDAIEYLVRVFVKDFKDPVSLLGKRNSTTLEIPHSTLRQETGKSLPDPVTVNVTVLAIRENEVVGIANLLTIKISGASIPGLNFISVIVLLVVTLSI